MDGEQDNKLKDILNELNDEGKTETFNRSRLKKFLFNLII